MRVQRPAPSAPRDFHFPSFELAVLENGMTIVVAPMHRLPVVTAIILLDGGASTEREGREGISDLVARALVDGTQSRTADELITALESLGTSVSASADWESTLLKMTVMSPHLPDALSLLSEMIREPRLDGASIDRLRNERLSEIIQTRSEPRVLADEAFSEALYEARARYAIPLGGSEASVGAITTGEAKNYHTANYSPALATLILAGDVTRENARTLAQRVFAEWETPKADDSARGPGKNDRSEAKKQIRILGRPGAQQSEVRMGHPGAPRSIPDYFAAVVMNAVLGGLFSSRINLNLREVHGYTYGASSYFDWRRERGPFVISSAVQSEVTGAAVREVLNEIDKIRSSEITQAELSLATSYLAGVFPIRYETSEAVASALASLVVFGLPEDYFTSYRAEILGVTTRDVRTAAEKYLQPENLTVVIVGSPDIVMPQLEDLNVGISVVPERT